MSISISPSPQKIFRSRISVLLILSTLAIFIPVSMPIVQNKAYEGMYVLGGSFFLLMFLLTGMRYVISGSKLTFKIWFIPSWSVDIADIRSVKRSYNLLSSPAASLKRLHITLNRETKYPDILISPVKEQKFIDELKSINPGINVNVHEKKGIWRIWGWDI